MGRLLRSLLHVPAIGRQMKRLADLEMAAAQQTVQIAGLEERIQQLSVEGDRCRAQLSGLRTAAHAADVRLHIVEKRPAAVAEQLNGSSAPAVPDPQPSEGSTIAPYTFEQLLNRDVEPYGPDLVFHVHVPKTAGTTVKTLLVQNNFSLLDFDMTTQSFFEVVREDRWRDHRRKPPPRAPYLLSGHFRLDLPILRQVPGRHAIVTLLRDPMARVLSHYNYTLRVEGNPWRAEVLAGTMSFLEYAEWLHAAIGPQYSFFDDTGVGTFQRSGTAPVEQCLNNLLTRVAIFGLTERFDEYCAIAGYLLGRPRVLAVGRANVTSRITTLHNGPMKEAMSDEELDRVSKLFADDIWFYGEARMEYERRISDPRLQTVLSETLPLMATCDAAVERLASIRDPANPERSAYARI